MRSTDRVDVAVVGGGIVGLATAYSLLSKATSVRLRLVEKEARLGAHQTGRNSGVIHSGIYYKPGSWKALLCRRARAALLRFAEQHEIPVRHLGKLIVAVDGSEIPHLTNLYSRGVANGLQGLREVTSSEIKEIEPNVTGLAAVHVPETAVIDFGAVAFHLGHEIERMGGEISLLTELTSISKGPDRWRLSTTQEDIEARAVIICAGLQSDRVARLVGGRPNYRVLPFEGKYVRLTPRAADLVRGLVYPVPVPASPSSASISPGDPTTRCGSARTRCWQGGGRDMEDGGVCETSPKRRSIRDRGDCSQATGGSH